MMRKILTLTMLFCAFMVQSMAQKITTTDYLVINHENKAAEEVELSLVQNISFIQNNTLLQIALPNARYRRMAIDPTDSFTFRTDTTIVEEEKFGTDFTVVPMDAAPVGPTPVGTVLCMRPEGVGTSTTFAFSELQVSSAIELRESAAYGVQFSVSAAKLGGQIDCAEEAGAFTLVLYNYATGTYVEAEQGTSGTIVTRKREDGTYAFRVNVVMQDGVQIWAEYDGAVTMVETMEGIVPLPKLPNEYTFFEYDNGNVLLHADITDLQIRKSTDGFWYFYFLDKVNSQPVEQSYTMPQIKIDPKLVNAGELKLEEPVGGKWAISYKDINLQSHDNDWVCWPDNGILKIAYNEATEEYDIYITIYNSYSSYNGTGLGNHLALTISYKGKASAYTGNKK